MAPLEKKVKAFVDYINENTNQDLSLAIVLNTNKVARQEDRSYGTRDLIWNHILFY
jgi:hypothetical protein